MTHAPGRIGNLRDDGTRVGAHDDSAEEAEVAMRLVAAVSGPSVPGRGHGQSHYILHTRQALPLLYVTALVVKLALHPAHKLCPHRTKKLSLHPTHTPGTGIENFF